MKTAIIGNHRGGNELIYSLERKPFMQKYEEAIMVDPKPGYAKILAEKFKSNFPGILVRPYQNFYEDVKDYLELESYDHLVMTVDSLVAILLALENAFLTISLQIFGAIPTANYLWLTGIQSTVFPGDEQTLTRVRQLMTFFNDVNLSHITSSREFMNTSILSAAMLDRHRRIAGLRTASNIINATGNDPESLKGPSLACVYHDRLLPLNILEISEHLNISELKEIALENIPVKSVLSYSNGEAIVGMIRENNKLSFMQVKVLPGDKRITSGFWEFDKKIEEQVQQNQTQRLIHTLHFTD